MPLKWHLADASGHPVTDLAKADITVENVYCDTGAIIDPLETSLTVGGGLQNLGNGDYQLNWKTSKAWAGSCKILTLDVGRGVTHQAQFALTR